MGIVNNWCGESSTGRWIAMAHFNLGHPTEARAALAQLRALMADPKNAGTWAKDEDAKALLAEAEALIDPPSPGASPKP
jgi:hypothetical protein